MGEFLTMIVAKRKRMLHKLLTCDPIAMGMVFFFLGLLILLATASCVAVCSDLANVCKAAGVKRH